MKSVFDPVDLASFDLDPSRGYWEGMGRESAGSTIGLRLRRERFARNLSLSDVAKRAGIAKSYLHKIEGGAVHNPGIATLVSLCRSIGYPIESCVAGLVSRGDIDG